MAPSLSIWYFTFWELFPVLARFSGLMTAQRKFWIGKGTSLVKQIYGHFSR